MKPIKLAILGNPIKHSLSPQMHNFWLNSFKINGEYESLKTTKKNLKETIKELSQKGYKGVNLTIPLKESSLKFLNKKDKIVRIIGAANVLIFKKNGHIEGKNTDVYGFKKSIVNLVKKKNTAIIIGSGGAARAVLYGLLELKYKEIFLFNRTLKKAEKIKRDFKKNFPNKLNTNIVCDNIKNINVMLSKSDLLINTTPMGMKGFPSLNIDLNQMKKKAGVVDLIYNPLETKLIKETKKRGLKSVNGLGMLIYQAQKSFYYWFSKTPKINNKLKIILEKEIK